MLSLSLSQPQPVTKSRKPTAFAIAGGPAGLSRRPTSMTATASLSTRKHDTTAAAMTQFDSKALPVQRDDIAPDGSDVRVLLQLARGGMAHFELGPGQTSKAVVHRRVEEIWYFLSGCGQIWRQQDGRAEVVNVHAGICVTIPVGTHFQFRSFGDEPLAAIGITMPPWPGESEAIIVRGEWQPTVATPGAGDRVR